MLKQNIFFVLVRPKYSGNLGFSTRVIKNFGFRNLVLIEPIAEINDEAYRYAMHARELLDSVKIYSSIEEFLEDMDIDYVFGTTARVGSEKNPLRIAFPIEIVRFIEIPEDSRIAILFGNEESGLNNRELSLCDFVLTIPTAPEYPALNLSHAVAIVAYEFALAIKTIRELPFRAATRKERKVLTQALIDILNIVAKKMPEGKREIYEGIIKNWVFRAFLTGREIHSLIGYARLVLKELQKLGM